MDPRTGERSLARIARPYVVPLLVLAVGTALSMLLFQEVTIWERGRIEAEFARAAGNRVAAFEHHIENSAHALDDLGAFYAGSQEVDRHEFQVFAGDLLGRIPALQALEWIPRVVHARREEYERAARDDGFAEFVIREWNADGALVPAGRRDEYFPVYFVEPYEGNELALGFDLASDPARRAALDGAHDSARMTATGRIRLVQERGEQFGFLMFRPVHKRGDTANGIKARREDLRGFALGVFRIGDMLEHSLAHLDPQQIDFSVFDDSSSGEDRFLHAHGAGEDITRGAQARSESELATGLHFREDIDVGGRNWRVWCTPGGDYLAQRETNQRWLVLTSGLLFTALLVGYVLLVLLRAQRVREQAQELSLARDGLEREISEREEAEQRLRASNRALKAISECGKALVRANDEKELLDEFCRIVVEVGGYRLAWIGYAQHDEHKSVRRVAQFGHDEGYLDGLELTWAETGRGMGPTGVAIRTRQPRISRDIQADPAYAPWRAEAVKRGYASSMSLPLVIGDEVLGAMNLYAARPDAFDTDEVRLMGDLAADLAYGLRTLRSRASRRAAEERVHLLSKAVEQSTEGLAVTDLEGNLLFVNHSFAEMHGYTPEELLGRHLSVFHTHDQMAAVDAANRKIRATGEYRGEIWHVRRNGAAFPGEIQNALLRSEEGEPFAIIGTLRDTTEQKRLKEELLKAEKLESVGLLAGGIAHDFNNLLTAIVGNLNLAKVEADNPASARNRLEGAERASARAQQLTQQLLTFARGGTPVKQALSVSELVQDTASFALRGSNVGCTYEVADDLWPVDADAGQISRVISNLVINANQAMPQGGKITIRCTNATMDGDGGLPLQVGHYVRIRVADQGAGIPHEHKARIFDPYFTTKQTGSGLGLASAYSIVKKHEGHITVESEAGVGSRFDVFLPASDKPLPRVRPPEASIVTRGRRILVMDDEAIVREVVGEMIRSLDCDAEFARDGADALEVYRRAKEAGRPFDVVMMDLTVPGGMGGMEAIERLRRYDPDVVAIVSSGYSNDPVVSEYEAHGFRGVLAKPYTRNKLGSVLREALAGRAKDRD